MECQGDRLDGKRLELNTVQAHGAFELQCSFWMEFWEKIEGRSI